MGTINGILKLENEESLSLEIREAFSNHPYFFVRLGEGNKATFYDAVDFKLFLQTSKIKKIEKDESGNRLIKTENHQYLVKPI